MIILQIEIKEVHEGKCNVNFVHDKVGQATPTEVQVVQQMMKNLASQMQPQAPKDIIIPGL